MNNRPLTRFGRVSAILSTLSAHEPEGLRLAGLVHAVGMPKTTVFRVLEELVEADFVSCDTHNQSYHVGDLIDVLARRACSRFELWRRIRPLLEQLVADVGDTVYFMQVRRDRLVCAERVVGHYPIQTLSLDVGDVRPIGVGSSGAAVASCLASSTLESLLGQQKPEREALSIDDESMLSIVAEARNSGYSFNPGTIVPGMSGLGVPLLGADGVPVGAVSLVAINARFEDGRRSYIADRLLSFRQEVEITLRSVLQ